MTDIEKEDANKPVPSSPVTAEQSFWSEDQNQLTQRTLERIIEVYGFHSFGTTFQSVLEEVGRRVGTVDDQQYMAWRLDTLLHELGHYVVDRGGLTRRGIDDLHKSFWNFPGHVQESAVCALVHLVQKQLVLDGVWHGVTTGLAESVACSGLQGPWKEDSRALAMVELMLHDPQLSARAASIARLITLARKSTNVGACVQNQWPA